MKLHSRCLPTGMLPYSNTDYALRMMAKLFDKNPYIPILPEVFPEESVLKRTLSGIPGICFGEKNNIIIKSGSEKYKLALAELEKACTSPTKERLEPYNLGSGFMENFEKLIVKFKPPEAYVNITGPFTISQILNSSAEEQMLVDKSFRKLFVQAVCAKALWAINRIKELSVSTTPVIVLEEPMLADLGTLKRDNEDLSTELVTGLFAKIVEKIQPTGALLAVQCYDKCDWKIPINAGVDIISFDAYNNPNNLCIIPDSILEFLQRGGKINWAIVPTKSESLVKSLNINDIEKRLITTLDGLVLAGIPRPLVYNSAMVSVQGDVNKLPIIMAEKVLMLANQLSKRIPVVKKQ